MLDKKLLKKLKEKYHPETLKVMLERELEDQLPKHKRPIWRYNPKTQMFENVNNKK